MNYLLSLIFILFAFSPSKTALKSPQQEVLQTVFNIEEFQNYLATSPRFVGTNTRQEVLMMDFPELENKDIPLTIRDKTVKIITEKEVDKLDLNFFIRIVEFDLKKSKAKVLLSYQNARMYYEKEQKILLDAQLAKTKEDEWTIENYKLYEVSLNTSD